MTLKQIDHINTSEPAVHSLKYKKQLHVIIVNKDNKPDYLAINIYWDTLRSWYNPKKIHKEDGNIVHINKLKTKGIYLNYKELSKIYNCSEETIRKKLVKLEQLGLIQRSFKHRKTITTRSYNQLIIYVWKDTPYFSNPYGVRKEEISTLTPQTNHKYIAEKHGVIFSSKPIQYKAYNDNGGIQPQEDTKELIKVISKDITRSTNQSNIFKIIKSKLQQRKTLKDFYPLENSDIEELQQKSGREFNKQAMNEILKDMGRKLTKPKFWSKKGFIAYMSEAFKYEKRDAVKISNETFRIKANLSKNEKYIQKRESFLDAIETQAITHVCPENQFKAKLANTLNADTAYALLSNFRSNQINNSKFTIYTNRQVELTKLEKATILSQAKATFERFENNIMHTIDTLAISV